MYGWNLYKLNIKNKSDESILKPIENKYRANILIR